MAKVVGATLVLFILSTGMELDISDPEEVEVRSSSGQFDAEILSVRDSSLVLVSPSGLSQDDLIKKKGQILVVRDDEIYSIKMAGSSNKAPLYGGAIGCISGCLIGAALPAKGDGCASEEVNRRMNAEAVGLLSGCGGILIGALTGSSTKDSLWITPIHRDFRALKLLARYPLKEPQFLKDIR